MTAPVVSRPLTREDWVLLLDAAEEARARRHGRDPDGYVRSTDVYRALEAATGQRAPAGTMAYLRDQFGLVAKSGRRAWRRVP